MRTPSVTRAPLEPGDPGPRWALLTRMSSLKAGLLQERFYRNLFYCQHMINEMTQVSTQYSRDPHLEVHCQSFKAAHEFSVTDL